MNFCSDDRLLVGQICLSLVVLAGPKDKSVLSVMSLFADSVFVPVPVLGLFAASTTTSLSKLAAKTFLFSPIYSRHLINESC